MEDIFDLEKRTYEKNKNNLIGKSRGKHVLIKKDKIIGVFDTKLDAIRQGYEKFGNVPLFVKQILDIETPQYFTSNLLEI
jgi:hypothetical protein